MAEHLLTSPSGSVLGFGLSLGLLMSDRGFSAVKQELNNRGKSLCIEPKPRAREAQSTGQGSLSPTCWLGGEGDKPGTSRGRRFQRGPDLQASPPHAYGFGEGEH